MTDTALTLIKLFEGFSPAPYSDIAGHGTVGYGHKIIPGEEEVFLGRVIGAAEAERLLVSDFEKATSEVLTATSGMQLWEWEREALASFTYNLGGKRLRESTLLRCVLDGQKRAAAQEFLRWRLAAGKPQAGLIRRRHVEAVWYLGAPPDTLFYIASDGRI